MANATQTVTLPDQTRANYRVQHNAINLRLLTCSSGATAPAEQPAGTLWHDTNEDRLKIRRTDGTAWVDVQIVTLTATDLTDNSGQGETDNSNALPPTQRAVRLYVEGEVATLNAALSTIAAPFDTSTTMVTGAGSKTFVPGLGLKPRVEMFLRCTTADAGRAVGDEIAIGGTDEGDGGRGIGFDILANGTVEYYQSAAPYIINRSTYTKVALVPANWRVAIRAWPGSV